MHIQQLKTAMVMVMSNIINAQHAAQQLAAAYAACMQEAEIALTYTAKAVTHICMYVCIYICIYTCICADMLCTAMYIAVHSSACSTSATPSQFEISTPH